MTPAQTKPRRHEPLSTSPALREYALRKGWQVLEYPERPGTARMKRPVFNRLMCDAWRHGFDVVLVPTLDCTACSFAELAENVTQLHLLEIRIQTADESVDTDPATQAGRSFLHTLAVLVRAESSMKVRNVRAGIAAAQRNGVHCGHPRLPFPQDRARRMQRNGLSIRKIAARLDLPVSTVGDALKGGKPAQTV